MKFLGKYVYQLDEKGRVALPAAFRRAAPEERFVLIQAYEPALSLYPESEWSDVEERLRELVRHQPESRLWVLSVMANAVEVSPDGQGRILIPSRLKEAAGLKGQAALVGAIDRIEIWKPELLDTAIEKHARDYGTYANHIFR